MDFESAISLAKGGSLVRRKVMDLFWRSITIDENTNEIWIEEHSGVRLPVSVGDVECQFWEVVSNEDKKSR